MEKKMQNHSDKFSFSPSSTRIFLLFFFQNCEQASTGVKTYTRKFLAEKKRKKLDFVWLKIFFPFLKKLNIHLTLKTVSIGEQLTSGNI